jgi:serine/threonine protein kinase
MSYCANPDCLAPDRNTSIVNYCVSCGANILLENRYRAQKLLGQGGFGRTFQAVDENQPGQPLCVIKQFVYKSLDPSVQQTAISLFREEVKHLASLGNHPQIPKLLSYFDLNGQPYLVQEFVDGQDLAQELTIEGVFSQQKIRDLLNSLLPVLDFLHNQIIPIIHRDIKPANIIRRSSDGSLVLVDFGAAKQATRTILAKTGTMIGSAEYSSPEQTRGKPTFASDVFSLGVTCINLLTGVSPFALFSTTEDNWVWRDYLVGNPIDNVLGQILDTMIVPAQSLRYRSATAVIDQLNTPYPLPPESLNATLLISNQKMMSGTSTNYRKFQGALSNRWKSFLTAQVEKNQPTTSNKKIFNWLTQWQKTDLIPVIYLPCLVEFFQEQDIDLDMLYIPACKFQGGWPQAKHLVTTSSFYLGQNPITERQYSLIMAKPETTDSQLPVTAVSWNDAQFFCDRLSVQTGKKYRLPTEAEWEAACRANTTTPYYFGNVVDSSLANFNYGLADSIPDLLPIDNSYPLNAFGLKDMHGNVAEWCEDSWHEHNGKTSINIITDYLEINTDFKVVRGGSRNNSSDCGHSSYREQAVNTHTSPFIGFRVACDEFEPETTPNILLTTS